MIPSSKIVKIYEDCIINETFTLHKRKIMVVGIYPFILKSNKNPELIKTLEPNRHILTFYPHKSVFPITDKNLDIYKKNQRLERKREKIKEEIISELSPRKLDRFSHDHFKTKNGRMEKEVLRLAFNELEIRKIETIKGKEINLCNTLNGLSMKKNHRYFRNQIFPLTPNNLKILDIYERLKKKREDLIGEMNDLIDSMEPYSQKQLKKMRLI